MISEPILKSLLFLYHLSHNLGLAIILLTLIVRLVLLPLIIPSLKSSQKMLSLKPELEKLKKKHAQNPQKLHQETLALYQKHGLSPASGCLPNLIQLIVLIALYRAFISTLGQGELLGVNINTHFLIWDLAQKDTTHLLPSLAALLQFLTSLALSPAIENEPEKRRGSQKQKEEVVELSQLMSQQMLFLMPLLTFFFALSFPSGLALYWVVTTLFSLLQQLIFVGPGGLTKLKNWFTQGANK